MGIETTMQHNSAKQKSGLMQRVLRSQGGNVALMSAFILVPVTLMIGSGIDFSRYYVIKSRMQLACDAGALAGRKAMGKTTFAAGAKAEANKFFDANFISGSYGSTDLQRTYTETDGIVSGTASAKMDTSILQLADIQDLSINVKCNGKLDISNTDVMFVLDTTGSMDLVDSGTASRMEGLRLAVKDFAQAMEDAKSSRTVIRYGFVPYASNVKVGHLLRREWVSDTNTIQSRETIIKYNKYGSYYTYNYKPITYDLSALKGNNNGLASPGSTMNLPVGYYNSYGPTMRSVSWNGCIEEAKTKYITNFNNLPSNLYDLDINHIPTAADDTKWKMQVPGLVFGRGKQVTPSPPHSYNHSGKFITGNEETSSEYYSPSDNGNYMATCINTARALQPMTKAEVGSYVDGLTPKGGTYHDIGMIWGGRLISPNGIFGSSNTAAASAGLTRHIIFMTDGSTSPTDVTLTAYGIEPLDQRRMGYWDLNNNRSAAITMADKRLQVVCNQIKNENITLWVVAFGTDVLNSAPTKSNLQTCASPGKYFEAADNATLRTHFIKIASQIAELRLVG